MLKCSKCGGNVNLCWGCPNTPAPPDTNITLTSLELAVLLDTVTASLAFAGNQDLFHFTRKAREQVIATLLRIMAQTAISVTVRP